MSGANGLEKSRGISKCLVYFAGYQNRKRQRRERKVEDKMINARIVITISGGVLVGVYSHLPLIVDLVDFDDLKAEGLTSKECDKVLKGKVKGLDHIY